MVLMSTRQKRQFKNWTWIFGEIAKQLRWKSLKAFLRALRPGESRNIIQRLSNSIAAEFDCHRTVKRANSVQSDGFGRTLLSTGFLSHWIWMIYENFKIDRPLITNRIILSSPHILLIDRWPLHLQLLPQPDQLSITFISWGMKSLLWQTTSGWLFQFTCQQRIHFFLKIK
jgi:hypothetical protein